MANNDFDLPRPTDPVPSSSSIVANDNSKVLDYLVNGTGTVVTRTGKPLTPFSDIIDTYGFGLADFTFAEGGVLGNKNLLVLGGSVYYKYIGSGGFPLTVSAGTNPVGNSDWLATAPMNHNALSGLNDEGGHDAIYARGLSNIAALRAFEPIVAGQKINILGHTVQGVGGGEFYYDSADATSADNNGTVIVTVGGKRWKRKNVESGSPEMFGALSSTDSADYIKKAAESFATVIISNPLISSVVNISDANVNMIFAKNGSLTAVATQSSILKLTSCESRIFNPKIIGASLAGRGIDASGGSLCVIGGSVSGFSSSTGFAAGIFAFNLSRLKVSSVNISDVYGIPNGTLGDAIGASRAVYAQSCYSVNIDGCDILNVDGEEGDSLHIAVGCVDSVIVNNRITGFSRRAIKVQAGNCSINNNVIAENAVNTSSSNLIACIEVVSGGVASIQRNNITTTTTPYGILLSSSKGDVSYNTVLSGDNDAGSGGLTLRQRAILTTTTNAVVSFNNTVGGYNGIEVQCGGVVHGNTSVESKNSAYTIGLFGGAVSSGVSFVGNKIKTLTANRMPSSAVSVFNHNNGTFHGTIFEGFDSTTNNVFSLSGSTGNNFSGTISNQEFELLGGDSAGNLINGTYQSSASFNSPYMAAGSQTTTTISVAGVKIGDYVQASVGISQSGLVISGYVSATGVVTLVLSNNSGYSVDLTNATYRVRVTPY